MTILFPIVLNFAGSLPQIFGDGECGFRCSAGVAVAVRTLDTEIHQVIFHVSNIPLEL
jgi:hypothetical protein